MSECKPLDGGEADMTSESTVSQFVNETLRGFPSTRTVFTLWSPGGGGGFLGVGGRGLHSFTLELNLSNSRTHS